MKKALSLSTKIPYHSMMDKNKKKRKKQKRKKFSKRNSTSKHI
jgi:hypothetical protein